MKKPMKIALYSHKPYETDFLQNANQAYQFDFTCLETRLDPQTAELSRNHDAVCCFVNDDLSADTIKVLAQHNIKLIALRCAGFNNVDLTAAKTANISVARVPAYSPYAVAEFTLALMLGLNRKLEQASFNIHHQNFSLNGLLGFDMYQKQVGIIGTGKIGRIVCKILQGFGCQISAYDVVKNSDCEQLGVRYVSLEQLYQQSDIISLHCPLNQHTHHMINPTSISQMRDKVMLINTSRGGLIDTQAVIQGLKSGKIGYLGLDVYEEEEHLFFQDLSNTIIQDDIYMRLNTFPNVLLTGHQAFFTVEAVTNIFNTTLENLNAFAKGQSLNLIDV